VYKQWQVIQLPTDLDSYTYVMDSVKFAIQPNTVYRVRVAAINDQSEGPASAVVTFETGSGGERLLK
jgi:hypothetical protein